MIKQTCNFWNKNQLSIMIGICAITILKSFYEGKSIFFAIGQTVAFYLLLSLFFWIFGLLGQWMSIKK